MRTDFFSSFADLRKEFSEHWNALWGLEPADRLKLIPYVLNRMQADTRGQAKEVVERAIAELPAADEGTVLKVLSVLTHVATEWNPVNDTPQGLLDDMGKLSLLPESGIEEAKDFMLSFFNALKDDSLRRLKEMFASSVAPNYRSSTALIDFRPVIDRPFGTGLDDRLEEYQPRCVAWVPIALVQFRYTDGESRSLTFQCGERDLRRIIDTFEAALRDLRAAKDAFGADRPEDRVGKETEI
jgi:hypothetical protein